MNPVKAAIETVGGWTWYIKMFKETHPEVVVDYKTLLQQYIKGIPYQEATI